MTITLPWWAFPVLLVLVGAAVPIFFFKRTHDYDMVSPLLGAGIFLICVAGALGLALGRLFS